MWSVFKCSFTRMLFGSFLLIGLMFGCSGDKSTNPGFDSETQQIVDEVTELQTTGYSHFSDLLAEMDTTAAIDSVFKFIMRDESVDTGSVSEQGIIIEYKNGVLGGIFIDPQDASDGTIFNIGKAVSPELLLQSADIDTPSSAKTVFINPHAQRGPRIFETIGRQGGNIIYHF